MPPKENCPQVRVGVRVKVRVTLKVGDDQTIAPEKNCPSVKVRVWVTASFGVGKRVDLFNRSFMGVDLSYRST